jgi:hypothetical protein
MATNSSRDDTERDLYGDLVEDSGGTGETLVRTQNAALRERVTQQDDELLSLKGRLRDLEETNTRVQDENLTLEKNISCLYKTAVLVRTAPPQPHRPPPHQTR